MSTWAWVGVGLGAFFLISALLSFAVAAILGCIGREASKLFESELWAQVPLTPEHVEAKTKVASPVRRIGPRRYHGLRARHRARS